MTALATVDVAVQPTDKFREFLETKRLRLTHERKIIVDEIFSIHEHFEPDQLVSRLSIVKGGRRVSRSTVYRTLSLLEEAGLLRKVARAGDRDVYEHDYGYPQHDHLICRKCGTLIEIPNDSIAELIDQIAADNGFIKSGHRLEVYGTCANCNRPPQRRHYKLDLV